MTQNPTDIVRWLTQNDNFTLLSIKREFICPEFGDKLLEEVTYLADLELYEKIKFVVQKIDQFRDISIERTKYEEARQFFNATGKNYLNYLIDQANTEDEYSNDYNQSATKVYRIYAFCNVAEAYCLDKLKVEDQWIAECLAEAYFYEPQIFSYFFGEQITTSFLDETEASENNPENTEANSSMFGVAVIALLLLLLFSGIVGLIIHANTFGVDDITVTPETALIQLGDNQTQAVDFVVKSSTPITITFDFRAEDTITQTTQLIVQGLPGGDKFIDVKPNQTQAYIRLQSGLPKKDYVLKVLYKKEPSKVLAERKFKAK
jgi:hypothetical protein